MNRLGVQSISVIPAVRLYFTAGKDFQSINAELSRYPHNAIDSELHQKLWNGGENSVSNEHSKLTLYDLAFEGVQIYDLLAENEGELTPELETRLDALIAVAPSTVEAAAMVVRSMEASADACLAEAARLTARCNGFNQNAKRLKERMAMVLDCAFNGKIKTDKFTIYTQANGDHISFDLAEGCTIEQVEAAAPWLVRVKKELDKVEIYKRFKANEPLPPAITFETLLGKRSLRIK